jgi:hypothetical protein
MHDFDVKLAGPLRWKGTGERDVLIVIVRPLAYRLSRNPKLLYRNPAYLICTDPRMSPERLMQAYLWRWEIELDFRDEKTVIGVGQAQVRTEEAVRSVPALAVATYSFLMLVAHAVGAHATSIPSPKWYRRKDSDRVSASIALSLFRTACWGIDIKGDKSGFVTEAPGTRSRFYPANSLSSALCYARK